MSPTERLLPAWYYKMPWLLQVLYNAPIALDLLDDDGYPDHQKVLPLIVVIGIFALAACGIPISTSMAVVLATAVYGPTMWGKFIDAHTLTGTLSESVQELKQKIENSVTNTQNTNTNTTNTTITKTVIARDPVDGVQPTGS